MKIAFIGAGRISYFHADAFRHAGADIVGIHTQGESGKEFSEKKNVPYFSSISEMCYTAKPDAAAILTQPSAYPSIIKELKEFDLPLFLEKPISYSAKEAAELKEILPKKVMVGQNRRFYSNMKPIKDLLRTGEKLTVYAHICERAKDIKLRDRRDRNHWHVMNGIHLIDLLKDLFGMPEKFLAKEGWLPLEFSNLNTHTTALYRTNKGHMVNFNCNFDSPGGWRFSVFSSGQEISVSPIEKTTVKVIGPHEEFQPTKEDIEFKAGFVEQSRCFINGVLGIPSESWVSFDDALESIQLTEMLFGEHQ